MLLLILLILAGDPTTDPLRPVHTYSIVAYDAETGEVGGAVQSHWFSVGSLVIWAEPGVGAVATQSFVNIDHGPNGLAAMKKGETPKQALQRLLDADPGREVRQVAMVDVKGNVAGHTGAKCIDYACDKQGDTFSVQANIMLKDTVCQAMVSAWHFTKGKPLAERLYAALEAAQDEGGDLRGKQSAAIKVVKAKASNKPWRDVVMDLRVEDHKDPIGELGRLIKVQQAYDLMNAGDVHLEHGKVDQAMKAYGEAVHQLPGRAEPIYWQAVNLVMANRLEEALPLFQKVFRKEPDWRKMTERLAKVGLLPDDKNIIDTINKQ